MPTGPPALRGQGNGPAPPPCEGPASRVPPAHEQEALLRPEPGPKTGSCAGVARLALAGAVLCGVVGALALRRALAPCVPGARTGRGAEQSLVSLVEVGSTEDLLNLAAADGSDDDALRQWLAATNEAGLAVGDATARDGDMYSEADKAVRRAMGASSREEGDRIVRRAMGRAAARMAEKRRSLKKFLADKRRGPRRNLKGPRGKRAPAEKAAVAACFFDVMRATSALAAMGANINDAVKTCRGVDAIHTFRNSTPAKVCILNTFLAMGSFSGIASVLSFAANDCAVSLVPNVDALCSSAVSGTISALFAFGGAAELMIETCKPDMEFREKYRIPVGAKASNVGEVGTPGDFEAGDDMLRRLGGAAGEVERAAEVGASSSAHPRRLLLGGGLESDQTFCFVDISTLTWFLAQAALSINQAGGGKTIRRCPPRNIAGGDVVKGPVFKTTQALCSVSINQVIGSFGAVASFLSMAFVHCANELNLKALCGSGVSGVLASMAALAGDGSGMHLTCNKFQKPAIKGALETARHVDSSLDGLLSTAANAVLSRRLEMQKAHDDLQKVLQDAEEDVAELKKRFKTPEEAWLSIGIDLSDPDADFRRVKPRRASPDRILELLAEEPEEVATEAKAAEQGGLLDGQRVCN